MTPLRVGDEVTTIQYLTSEEAPPNWSALVEYNSEHTKYQGNASQEWLYMPDMVILETTPLIHLSQSVILERKLHLHC